MNKTKKCDLCEKQFEGYGHGPHPFKGKVCCDACNDKIVVPIRKAMTYASRKPTKAERESADKLWALLRDAFNKEAKHYDPETNISRLGSIGDVTEREVMRSAWWDFLKAGELFGEENYDRLTRIIEREHNGEQLETGKITFGS